MFKSTVLSIGIFIFFKLDTIEIISIVVKNNVISVLYSLIISTVIHFYINYFNVLINII